MAPTDFPKPHDSQDDRRNARKKDKRAHGDAQNQTGKCLAAPSPWPRCISVITVFIRLLPGFRAPLSARTRSAGWLDQLTSAGNWKLPHTGGTLSKPADQLFLGFQQLAARAMKLDHRGLVLG